MLSKQVVSQRSSNLELYRILCMLLIVAHHFVVNSGLNDLGGPLQVDPTSDKSLFLYLWGMWGKVGINCFLMITGYFMCKSTITIRKFIKLLFQIYFYTIIIFSVFALFTDYESISVVRVAKLFMPVWGFASNFVSCFLVFWLTIPFWNILIANMNKKLHLTLVALLLGNYTILGSIPTFDISFNYITWFGIIYLIASYIRIYPHPIFAAKKFWGIASLLSIVLSMLSVYVLAVVMKFGNVYFFVNDSNRLFAVLVAVTTFLWFKNLNISYNKIINYIGASTFGVLLIHANSDAMRTWLWKDTLDVVGHYSLPFLNLVIYSLVSTISVFCVCALIDFIRLQCIEKPFFKWYDNQNNNI